MFVFGHLGIGTGLVHLLKRGWPVGAVLLGTLLPDLVDKPLFYGVVRHRLAPEAFCAMFCGTRTIGHTLLATAFIAVIARLRSSAWLLAVAAGMFTHIVLDIASDALASAQHHVAFAFASSGAWRAAVFPLAGTSFAPSANTNLVDHMLAIVQQHVPTELLGISLLGALLWRSAQRQPSTPSAPPTPLRIPDSGARS
jgi:hypothetical protein